MPEFAVHGNGTTGHNQRHDLLKPRNRFRMSARFVDLQDGDQLPELLGQQVRRRNRHVEMAGVSTRIGTVAEVDDGWVPYIDMCTGAEIFAEAFGCAVHRPSDNMPFALPRIHIAAEVAAIQVPELSHSSLAYRR